MPIEEYPNGKGVYLASNSHPHIQAPVPETTVLYQGGGASGASAPVG